MEILRPFTTNPAPEKFWNRKQFYSINCIMIVDHSKRIRYFTNRNAGSSHDSRIWEESNMKQMLLRREPNNLQFLIGDEGFANRVTLYSQLSEITDARKISQVKAYNCALKRHVTIHSYDRKLYIRYQNYYDTGNWILVRHNCMLHVN